MRHSSVVQGAALAVLLAASAAPGASAASRAAMTRGPSPCPGAACALPRPAGATTDSLTLSAPRSGWQISVPHDWTQQMIDDPEGGTARFTSPDGELAMGVSTIQLPEGMDLPEVIPMLEESMDWGANPYEVRPATIHGVTGEMRSYVWQSEGAWMVAYAFYARSGPHLHVVWAVLPEPAAPGRSQQVFAIMQTYQSTFRMAAPAPLPDTAAPAAAQSETSVARPRSAGPALALALLSAGAAPGENAALLRPDTAEVNAVGQVVGTGREGVIEIALIYAETGYQVGAHRAALSGIGAGPVIEVSLAVTRPDNGWPEGVYRVVVRHDQAELGSRMFSVERAAQ
ncbi:hypothetical protein [Actibacterium sp. MT2.3-13A]|uniref:hypothetical protein n=1 Tax=Actibacterium sp. MT2.3-13A TaxID=2828332 RepID=UPI001BA5F9ED|nr:hypothetical protein [Actibacterium sp. MT2.3-13A]